MKADGAARRECGPSVAKLGLIASNREERLPPSGLRPRARPSRQRAAPPRSCPPLPARTALAPTAPRAHAARPPAEFVLGRLQRPIEPFAKLKL
eukprot:6943445-Prymnesium_polylepis.2